MKRLYAALSLIALLVVLVFPAVARADDSPGTRPAAEGWTWDEAAAPHATPEGWTWDEA